MEAYGFLRTNAEASCHFMTRNMGLAETTIVKSAIADTITQQGGPGRTARQETPTPPGIAGGVGNRKWRTTTQPLYEPIEPATLLNVLLALLPTWLMAVRHTTTIKASITAYSTAVGPSSETKSRRSVSMTGFIIFLIWWKGSLAQLPIATLRTDRTGDFVERAAGVLADLGDGGQAHDHD